MQLRRRSATDHAKRPRILRRRPQGGFRPLVSVSAGDHLDLVARDCWEMVFTIEEIRRESGRKVWKMQRLRPKIAREGERSALEYCARNRTEGFDEVLSYGLPQFTAEAIVLRYPAIFAADTLERARGRLIEAGIDVDAMMASFASG